MTKRRILYIILDDMSSANISFCVARGALKSARAVRGLVRALSAVPDFRMDRRKRHRLVTILVIGVMCLLSYGSSFRDMEAYGKKFRLRLSRFLPMANGVPSHDTFGRVFSKLPPESLVQGLGVWLRAVAGRMDGKPVSFDGKSVRRACEKGKDGRAPHVESAWADGADVCLGQVRVAEKENEIVAIPKLVRRLFLGGAVLTFDAMGCQREIAAVCRDAGAHYLLPLKDNQPTVSDEVTRFMRHVRDTAPKSLTYSGAVDKGHGRLWRRKAWQSCDVAWFEDRARWRDLAGFVMIETSRWEGGKWTDPDVRCYLTSLAADASRLRRIARAHWGVENRLHWVLDVVFGEDYCRARSGFAPENLNALRKLALTLLRRNGIPGKGVKDMRLECAWDFDLAVKVLFGGESEEVR